VLAEDVPIVTLATAHPAKFPKAVQEAYATEPDTPQRVVDMLELPEQFTPVANNLADVQALIREKARVG
jgi:threonine synthase